MNSVADDEETGLNKDIKDTLERIIKLWKLCEIIFIKSSPCEHLNNYFYLFFNLKIYLKVQNLYLSWCITY